MSRIAIVSFPWPSYAPYKFISDLLAILDPITDELFIITGNSKRINICSDNATVKDIGIEMHFLRDVKPIFLSVILWIFKSILIQFKMSLELIKLKNNIDIVFFYVAYPYYLLPLITAKLLDIKTVEVITRSTPDSLFAKILRIQDPILFSLLDAISPESPSVIRDLYLFKYKSKLVTEGARFVDTTQFKITKNIENRENIIGFIGRIQKEKGIIEFVNSIPIIFAEKKNVKILIGGSGELLDWVIQECDKLREKSNIDITISGWIGSDLPFYLNDLKLLVLPTHTDSFPTIILEAMACGTPVLATNVGAISDVIENGITGFLIENNSPECIANGILKALSSEDLNTCSENGQIIVRERYNYGAAVERYRSILGSISEL